jgi:hypothetical protein
MAGLSDVAHMRVSLSDPGQCTKLFDAKTLTGTLSANCHSTSLSGVLESNSSMGLLRQYNLPAGPFISGRRAVEEQQAMCHSRSRSMFFCRWNGRLGITIEMQDCDPLPLPVGTGIE